MIRYRATFDVALRLMGTGGAVCNPKTSRYRLNNHAAGRLQTRRLSARHRFASFRAALFFHAILYH